jgi:hypothetical protein
MNERRPFLYPGPQAALLRRVATLTVEELHALDAAVRDLAAERVHKQVDKGFLFAWWEGPDLSAAERIELEDLFSAVLVALASGLTDIDVERVGARFAPKPSWSASLMRWFTPPRRSRQLQDVSIGLIEDHLAPWDPRRAVTATWNMVCAAALQDRVPASTITVLEAPWRRALGDPPI